SSSRIAQSSLSGGDSHLTVLTLKRLPCAASSALKLTSACSGRSAFATPLALTTCAFVTRYVVEPSEALRSEPRARNPVPKPWSGSHSVSTRATRVQRSSPRRYQPIGTYDVSPSTRSRVTDRK